MRSTKTNCRTAYKPILISAKLKTGKRRHKTERIVRSPLNFRRRIKSRMPFAGIIRRLPYSTRFQDKG